MVYRCDCRYLPYSIHLSEFMSIFFTRKRTKHENTRSPPFSPYRRRLLMLCAPLFDPTTNLIEFMNFWFMNTAWSLWLQPFLFSSVWSVTVPQWGIDFKPSFTLFRVLGFLLINQCRVIYKCWKGAMQMFPSAVRQSWHALSNHSHRSLFHNHAQ